ncbi:MAG: MFS transporter [Gammaproteobacteria bacterium]|nr:MFS transporter [Gammaproteobacteria bacterium]
MTPTSNRKTIAIFCLAQTLAQLGAFTFPALLPVFFGVWSLSHTEAGWLSGVFFGAYSLSVPLLVTLTDRVDARRIYMWAVVLTTLSHLGMAFAATGFWSAFLFRVLAGVGWAGTYMVGLKALADRVEGASQSRAVAFHAASIGISGSLSFMIAGVVTTWFDWQVAFMAGALGTLGALCVAAAGFPRSPPVRRKTPNTRLLDFRPVLKNRSVMAYAIGYCVHTWEMFVVRSWVVTFLVFTAAQPGEQVNFLVPTVVAMLMELVGTATSVLGNEMAVRFGRQRWIMSVMLASMLIATIVGFSSAWGYGVATAICLLYNAFIYADSSSLTAGTVGNADPESRGAALAVHAMLGYGGGFVGPLVMGLILDALGGESVLNWGIGFAHLALIMVIGPVALKLLKPGDLEGDRPSRSSNRSRNF